MLVCYREGEHDDKLLNFTPSCILFFPFFTLLLMRGQRYMEGRGGRAQELHKSVERMCLLTVANLKLLNSCGRLQLTKGRNAIRNRSVKTSTALLQREYPKKP